MKRGEGEFPSIDLVALVVSPQVKSTNNAGRTDAADDLNFPLLSPGIQSKLRGPLYAKG